MLCFGLGASIWAVGFFRSFGTFSTGHDVRLVTTGMELGLVLMLVGIFAVGVQAVRRLERAAKSST